MKRTNAGSVDARLHDLLLVWIMPRRCLSPCPFQASRITSRLSALGRCCSRIACCRCLWTPSFAYAQSDRPEIDAAQRYELSPCSTVLRKHWRVDAPAGRVGSGRAGTVHSCVARFVGSASGLRSSTTRWTCSAAHRRVQGLRTGRRFHGTSRRVGLTTAASRVMPGLLFKQLQQAVEPAAVDRDHGLFPDPGLCVIRHRQS